jgi:hypothetical protein
MQMRIRGVEIDLVVAAMAVAATVIGLASGFGVVSILGGVLILGAALGSRFMGAWVTQAFALPPRGTQERGYVIRSLGAAAAMKTLVSSVPGGPVAARCREMERQARTALPTIRALALQTYRVRRLADAIPLLQLESERAHTASLINAGPGEGTRIELESSLRSTESQVRTGIRLRALADELAARTRALTASLNAAAAGIAELQALSSSDPTAQTDLALASLSREIEALREGLQEAQAFGRKAAAVHLLEV